MSENLRPYDKIELIQKLMSNKYIYPKGTVKTVKEWCFIIGREFIDLSWTPDKRVWKLHSKDEHDDKFYENVVAIFPFGSSVYGTYNMNPDKPSDFDEIWVVKEYFDSGDINRHIFTKEQFQAGLDRCDIQMVECYFSSKTSFNSSEFKFILDLKKLRTSISTIVSNSWVKGKKKLVVTGDYDLWLGIKSIFHSLRILDYGIQLASHGKIINFASMNYVLYDMIDMSKRNQRDDLWEAIDTKYRSLYNSKNTEFKLLAPKDLGEKDKKVQLTKILKKYLGGEVDQDLVNEILIIL